MRVFLGAGLCTVALVSGSGYRSPMGYRVVPKSQLRERLREEFDSLLRHDLVITDRSRPIAVLVHIERWSGLQEKVEWLEEAIELADRGMAIPIPTLHTINEPGPIRR
ncbi:MAG TPA: type II toxin-antitoxin system prevent-host-death family antitoxin [Actinomycetota bacterium]|nr:type II toxin-antitoxin system prevent-host-death family antitoxin [Actinomycetota bacterium]